MCVGGGGEGVGGVTEKEKKNEWRTEDRNSYKEKEKKLSRSK